MLNDKEKLIELLTDCGSVYPKADATYLIANGVTVQRWIPVTERLPEPYKDVLVVEYNGWDQKVEVNSMLSNGWLYDGRTVTHWMPLPDAPKDGDSE